MWMTVKSLSLGVALIALTSGLLLVSDWKGGRTGFGRHVPRVAILQHASQPLLDEGVAGILAGLAAGGFTDGSNIAIQRFNAENDVATGNAIARQLVGGQFDLVITSSTRSLQAVASANKDGKVLHVFGIVADPFSAGVGLNRSNPLDHPRHLVGVGSFVPVDKAFQLARKLFPTLKSVGVAWNPSESNSEAFIVKAREASRELGIELVETAVDNSSGVGEAARSLVARGVDALWIGGDVTVMVAADSVIAAARQGRIPVFSIAPPTAQRGALFDFGANFHVVGEQVGELAAQILHGADPAKIPIRNSVPEKIVVNRKALRGLKDPWRLPPEVLDAADAVIDEKGMHEKAAPPHASVAPSKKWKLRLVELNNVDDVKETEQGIRAGLRESGLVEKRDYEVTTGNAQGDMATVNGLIDAAVDGGADMLITLSSPTLQVAAQRARSLPVVFSYVASAVAAGAGRSDTDHLLNVTGVYFRTANAEMRAVIRECLPRARSIGTLFVPSEVNSVYTKDLLAEEARRAGLELVTVAAGTSSEVPDAALALASRKIDALCQIPGNLTAAAFSSIVPAARRARLPVFAFQTIRAREGATVVLARDYVDAGKQTAQFAARSIRGESPASIPFQPVGGKIRLLVNVGAARTIGLDLPPALIQRADRLMGM